MIAEPSRPTEARPRASTTQQLRPAVEPLRSSPPRKTAEDERQDTSRAAEPLVHSRGLRLEPTHTTPSTSGSPSDSPGEHALGASGPKPEPVSTRLSAASPVRPREDDLPNPAPQPSVEPSTAEPTGLEPVIEVQRVPGPIVLIERQVAAPERRAPRRPRQKASALPPAAKRQVPRKVVFVPREPLVPLGLEPLQVSEVLTDAVPAEAISPESVVHVHIGRLEVSRPAPAAAPSPPPKRSAVLSLDQYIEQRTAKATGRGGSW